MKEKKELPFKVGDNVKGLILADLCESTESEIIDRVEKITEIRSKSK